jgi:hypothetical protein
MTKMETLTFKLNNGINVLARYKSGILCPYQYIGKAQAEKKAFEVNGEVIRPTRAYYVKINKG